MRKNETQAYAWHKHTHAIAKRIINCRTEMTEKNNVTHVNVKLIASIYFHFYRKYHRQSLIEWKHKFLLLTNISGIRWVWNCLCSHHCHSVYDFIRHKFFSLKRILHIFSGTWMLGRNLHAEWIFFLLKKIHSI